MVEAHNTATVDQVMENAEEYIRKFAGEKAWEAFVRHRGKIQFGERPAYPHDSDRVL